LVKDYVLGRGWEMTTRVGNFLYHRDFRIGLKYIKKCGGKK